MYTIKCPNCGSENKNTNIRCEVCNSKLVRPESITTSKRGELTFEEQVCRLGLLIALIGFGYITIIGFQLLFFGFIAVIKSYDTAGVFGLIYIICTVCIVMAIIIFIISTYKASKKEQK